MGSYRYCMCFTRKFHSDVLEPPEDVKDAFYRFAGTGASAAMSAEQLQRFMVEVQGQKDATLAEAERIVEQLHKRHHLAILSKPTLSFDDFYEFLSGDEFNAAIGSQVHQDMTAPLSEYFIFTGHNSYLTGNQLSSEASHVPIIKALQRGVRVIELDMWPNSNKDNVDILHGRTLTSPVEMIKCLRAIKDYAFCASPYPVVITLEDHLTPDLQAKVAEMVTQTFGDMLYIPESETLAEFPSPEALKNKIVISTKPPKEYLEAKNCKEKEECSAKDKDSSSDGDESTKSTTKSPNKSGREQEGMDQVDEDSDDDDQGLKQTLAPEYKRIITVPAGKPKGRMRDALKVDPYKVRRLSLSEQKLSKAAESHAIELVRFTQKNILRIYPKGTRFNSSNYDPMIGWIHGAQMVAFNMQGHGKALWLMQGLFRANGSCGYVKKPNFMLKLGRRGETFNPEVTLPVKTTLKVKIYLGDGWRLDFDKKHFDSYSPPDFYTRIGIAGVRADKRMLKTKVKADDWRPVWNEEFSFSLSVPELALLRIEVREYDKHEKDDFGGQNCFPVWELRQGIRAVPLYDRKGVKLRSVRLLMRFEFV